MTEEIKFEKAMERLEKIVEDLEGGNISLEDALKKYEEGVKLTRVCQQHLSQAEKKIHILSRASDGSLQKAAFDIESCEKESKPSRTKSKAVKAENLSEEEDLLI